MKNFADLRFDRGRAHFYRGYENYEGDEREVTLTEYYSWDLPNFFGHENIVKS